MLASVVLLVLLNSTSFFIRNGILFGQAMRIGLKLPPTPINASERSHAYLANSSRRGGASQAALAESMLQSRLTEAVQIAADLRHVDALGAWKGALSWKALGLIGITTLALLSLSVVVYAELRRDPKLSEDCDDKPGVLAESDDCAMVDNATYENDSGTEVNAEPSTMVQAAAKKTLRFAASNEEIEACDDQSTDDEEDPVSREFTPKITKQMSCPAVLKAYHWEPVLSSSDESESAGEEEIDVDPPKTHLYHAATSAQADKKKGKQRAFQTTKY